MDQRASPPTCGGSTLSLHARALAVDIAGVKLHSGREFVIGTSWVPDFRAQTCGYSPEDPDQEFLHGLLCAVRDRRLFHNYLTPNYNPGHWNHWHLDLAPDELDFVQ